MMDLFAMSSWWGSNLTLRTLYVLFVGQLLSFSLALASFSSSLIANLGVNAPFAQSIFTYLSLALVYGSILLYRRQSLKIPWYWYLLLGFADVHGNFLVNKGYQFTSITSVQLLDCFAIAWAIALTSIFLGTRYSLWQLCGAAICVAGLGLVLLSDSGVGGGGGSRPFFGDTLVILGTLFYAMANVGEEFCVKNTGRVEVVAMMAVFGMVISTVELSVLELKHLESVKWSTKIVLAFIGYALASFMFYTLAPVVLKVSGSAMLNLSLLTSDMWAVVFRIFFYHQEVDMLYYLAFVVVVVGIIIYSTNEQEPVQERAFRNGIEIQYETIDGENAG